VILDTKVELSKSDYLQDILMHTKLARKIGKKKQISVSKAASEEEAPSILRVKTKKTIRDYRRNFFPSCFSV
jgi:hypothetical protein